MATTISYRFLMRGGTSTAIAALNEIPKARELVIETNTLKFKLGDGVTHWNSLGYFSTSSVVEGSNLYFTDERAQDAIAAAFAAGTHTGITVTYNDASNSISLAVSGLLTSSITNGDTTHAPNGDAVFDALALKADLASPTFTGTPAAPTASAGNSSTLLATTAFVQGVSPIGKQSVPIMAGSMAPSASGGCASLATVASAANQPDIVTLDFDASTEEYAQFAIPMPKSWNEGTITAAFRWSHAATTTNFGVVWGIQAVAVSDDDTIAVSYGTAQTVTDTGGTTNDLYVTSETSAITVAGSPATADTVYFRVYRKSADGSDTMAIDARLHSVILYITTDAATDA